MISIYEPADRVYIKEKILSSAQFVESSRDRELVGVILQVMVCNVGPEMQVLIMRLGHVGEVCTRWSNQGNLSLIEEGLYFEFEEFESGRCKGLRLGLNWCKLE